MQIEYTVGPSGPLVHVFGRDKSGEPVHVQVTGFRPYFYVPADLVAAAPPSPRAEVEENKRYTSIRGEELVRIYTERPTDVAKRGRSTGPTSRQTFHSRHGSLSIVALGEA